MDTPRFKRVRIINNNNNNNANNSNNKIEIQIEEINK